jgi:TRAP-type C4-dicarboxylate transport system permease large subunit
MFLAILLAIAIDPAVDRLETRRVPRALAIVLVYVVLLAEIGAVTPPVGINCFVVQSASNGLVTLEEVFKGLMPYIAAGLLMLVILCLFPELALYLPSRMRG